MEWLALVVALVFALLGLACVFSVILGLPGTWMMLGLAALIEFADRWYLPEGDRQTFSWWLLAVCVALGLLGELLEFIAGVFGAKRAGATKRGMVGSLLGGLLGAFMGLLIPMPVLGSLIGAVIGTFVGAILGELTHPQLRFKDSLGPATGATIGKILGTVSKLPLALTVWLLLVTAAFWL